MLGEDGDGFTKEREHEGPRRHRYDTQYNLPEIRRMASEEFGGHVTVGGSISMERFYVVVRILFFPGQPADKGHKPRPLSRPVSAPAHSGREKEKETECTVCELECLTRAELEAALREVSSLKRAWIDLRLRRYQFRPPSRRRHGVNLQGSGSTEAFSEHRHLRAGEAFEVLRRRFHLDYFSVRDALEADPKSRIDHSGNGTQLYCAVMAFRTALALPFEGGEEGALPGCLQGVAAASQPQHHHMDIQEGTTAGGVSSVVETTNFPLLMLQSWQRHSGSGGGGKERSSGGLGVGGLKGRLSDPAPVPVDFPRFSAALRDKCLSWYRCCCFLGHDYLITFVSAPPPVELPLAVRVPGYPYLPRPREMPPMSGESERRRPVNVHGPPDSGRIWDTNDTPLERDYSGSAYGAGQEGGKSGGDGLVLGGPALRERLLSPPPGSAGGLGGSDVRQRLGGSGRDPAPLPFPVSPAAAGDSLPMPTEKPPTSIKEAATRPPRVLDPIWLVVSESLHAHARAETTRLQRGGSSPLSSKKHSATVGKMITASGSLDSGHWWSETSSESEAGGGTGESARGFRALAEQLKRRNQQDRRRGGGKDPNPRFQMREERDQRKKRVEEGRQITIKGLPFLFFKVFEALVRNQIPSIDSYRRLLLTFEERTFSAKYARPKQDIRMTLQLHLMHRELLVIRHHLLPVERILSTLAEYSNAQQHAHASHLRLGGSGHPRGGLRWRYKGRGATMTGQAVEGLMTIHHSGRDAFSSHDRDHHGEADDLLEGEMISPGSASSTHHHPQQQHPHPNHQVKSRRRGKKGQGGKGRKGDRQGHGHAEGADFFSDTQGEAEKGVREERQEVTLERGGVAVIIPPPSGRGGEGRHVKRGKTEGDRCCREEGGEGEEEEEEEEEPMLELDEEVCDWMEEVRDDVRMFIYQVTELSEGCRDVLSLVFEVTNYRSTVAQEVLAGVATVFLPLTWIAGIYGTNFLIFPELTWGLDHPEGEQPEGWPAGYLYFWAISLLAAVLAVVGLIVMKVF